MTQERIATAQQPWRRVGPALANPNIRSYLAGHLVSQTGQWLQQTAELWILLELTRSGTGLGLHAVIRFAPLLILGAYGGVIVDRLDHRKLLFATQGIQVVAVAVFTVAVWVGRATAPMVYTVVAIQGLVFAVDNPLRRNFLRDLSSDEELVNAVSLQGSASVLARTIGPAIAGVLIATVGTVWCFAINCATFVFFIWRVVGLDRDRMRPQVLISRAPGQLREGLLYAWRHRGIRMTLVLCAAVSTFAWNHNVLVPFYATAEFDGGSSLYGMLLSVLGVGSVVGTLAIVKATEMRMSMLFALAGFVAAAMTIVAVSPTIWLAGLGLAFLGATSSAFMVGAQARLQVAVDDLMSGRVLALYGVVFLGTKPIGGYLSGWIVDLSSSRVAFGACAIVVALVVALLARSSAGRRQGRPKDRQDERRLDVGHGES